MQSWGCSSEPRRGSQAKPWKRRLAWAAGCCATVLVVAGCSGANQDVGQEFVTADIVQVYGRPDSTRLELSVGSCNRQPRIDVIETTTEVLVAATAQRPDPGGEGDCLDSVTTELTDPLGSRPVVDDSTDETLRLLPLED